ncbi:uncharacterized protein FOMMEDRAFT_104344 [Fomitiporia mediterranea MF3/22]|uniref:uncharacterized protein n=1 Tax=Fomitiporia mediterranea (strain MF3/22) TaxID=694068 RepID=UPI0004409577|nr:uncharacterized protein FOMMEDRAFT_104344 [Fomitiporia mediterranea MF3/22]EJD05960.1 hypothetical protein FOMMEDRAFT_104344 [Fomitiporia mediterranea MF3/22]
MVSPSKSTNRGSSHKSGTSSSPKGQATISSYFSQSTSSPSKHFATQTGLGKRAPPSAVVDLTEDASDNELPVAKKKRVGSSLQNNDKIRDNGNSLPSRSPRTPKKSISKYGFNHSSDPPEAPETPEEKRAKKTRREAFKRKLLADNGMFGRRPEVVQSKKQAEVVDEDVMDIDDLDAIRERSRNESELEGSDQETSVLPAAVTSKAFSSSKGKEKARASETLPAKRSKKEVEVGPSGQTYTPLEKQVLALKEKYLDAILMFEVGYKYRFFGEDARIASEVLNIAHFPDRNFLTASVPDHRRDIHLRRLLSHGYKVGIIGQMETAALKKISDTRNKPFERALTHMYTAATYIDEIDADDDDSRIAPPVFMCICESMLGGMGVDERVSISMVAVTPSTSDVLWDEFEDGFMRNELETRMAHIRPSEILSSKDKLSKVTQKILQYHSKESSSKTLARDRVRLERYDDEMNYTDAFRQLQTFYAQKGNTRASENFKSGKLLAAISDLPRKVVIALAHSLNYLNSFGLGDVLTEMQFFSKFTERQHMLLNANTLSNLEIYRNQTDFTMRGSLMWVLNRTKTTFGARLLKSWIGRPLTDVGALQARVDAVEAIISAEASKSRERLLRLRELLKEIGKTDLAKGLSRIQYFKCTPKELARLLRAFGKAADAFLPFENIEDVGLANPVLNEIIFTLPKIRDSVRKIGSCLNLKKADEDKRDELWSDPDKYPEVDDLKMAIMVVESELADHLKTMNLDEVDILLPFYRLPSKSELRQYLVEVKKNEKRDIPVTWEVVSSTKSARRYRTPEVRKMLQERAQFQEKLKAEANKAYVAFLSEIMDEHYVVLRNAVNKLAVADCLFSLAEVASQGNYVKPVFVDQETDILEITDGRHPMIELLRSDPFVPNTVCIGGSDTKTKIITGPNMGGKSSATRMVALIALMAQIGTYVPAASVRLSPLDAILTRMGASDDLAKGRSTFMVEMSETSDILHSATKRSLVILDELGRGSSTFDGMAIAGATLEHLVENISCKTLFITHYPVVASSSEQKHPDKVINLHMGFTEETTLLGKRTITFLYQLTKGISSGSYGIECARLAGISESLLEKAEERAEFMQRTVQSREQIVKYVVLVSNYPDCMQTCLICHSSRTRKVINILNRIQASGTSHTTGWLGDLRTLIRPSLLG